MKTESELKGCPEAEVSVEAQLIFPRFTDEQRRLLEEGRFFIYELSGRSLLQIVNDFSSKIAVDLYEQITKFEIDQRERAIRSEVAILNNRRLLTSANLDLQGQLAQIDTYGTVLSSDIPGTKAVHANLATHLEIEKMMGMETRGDRSLFYHSDSPRYNLLRASTRGNRAGASVTLNRVIDSSEDIGYFEVGMWLDHEGFSLLRVMPVLIPGF